MAVRTRDRSNLERAFEPSCSSVPSLPIHLEPLPSNPLVSILVANYNYAPFIGAAIESALAQTYDHLEVVICDDGSTDDSCSVIESFAQRDSRVKLVRLSVNQGMAAAFNAAFNASTGEIICFLDADDLYDLTKVARVVEHCRQHPQAGLILHRLLMVDSGLRPIQELPFLGRFETGWLADRVVRRGGRWRDMPGGAICLRRAAADLAFPIPVSFRRAADGFVFTLLPLVTEVSAMDDMLYLYRIHGSNDYAAQAQSLKGLTSQQAFIESQIAAVNARLHELGPDGPVLDPDRHLTLTQIRYMLVALQSRTPGSTVKAYLSFSRMLLHDDLHRRTQKLMGLVVFGVAIMIPRRMRDWWFRQLLGPARFKLVAQRWLRRVRRVPVDRVVTR